MPATKGPGMQRPTTLRRTTRVVLGTLAALAAGGLVLVAAPAWAHVEIDPGTATQGGYTAVSFRVPNETDATSTTQVQVFLPQDHPLASVSVKPLAGWHVAVVSKKLARPAHHRRRRGDRGSVPHHLDVGQPEGRDQAGRVRRVRPVGRPAARGLVADLQDVADLLRRQCRPLDRPARAGGPARAGASRPDAHPGPRVRRCVGPRLHRGPRTVATAAAVRRPRR